MDKPNMLEGVMLLLRGFQACGCLVAALIGAAFVLMLAWSFATAS